MRIAPWRGLGSGSVSCCCFSALTAAYSAKLSEDVCTTEELSPRKLHPVFHLKGGICVQKIDAQFPRVST